MLTTDLRRSTRETHFSSKLGRPEHTARKAEKAGQFLAAAGAITALIRMMALGADQKTFRGYMHHGHFYRC